MCFRSLADGRASWDWRHSCEFSLPVPAGSPEKKPGAGEDAPRSPSRPVHACSPPPGLPVSRAAVFADAPHCYRVTGADPAGFLWIGAAASPRISGSLCYSALLQLVGNPGLEMLWVLAEQWTQDPPQDWVTLEFSWSSKVRSSSGAQARSSGLEITIAGLADKCSGVSAAAVTFLMATIRGSLADMTTVSDFGVGGAWCRDAWAIGVGAHWITMGVDRTGMSPELGARHSGACTGPAVDSCCTGGRLAGRLQGSRWPEVGVVRALCTSSWSEPLALCT